MMITDLPNELIIAIYDHLPADNIFSFRRSCRRMEQATAKIFTKRYYEELCILVTPRNMEFLRFVANHETLRQSVRALYIFPGLWESWKDLKLESFDYYNGRKSREMVPPKLAQDRFEAYRQILDGHLELVNGDGLQQCLNETLGHFPNLEAVGLKHRSSQRDANLRLEPLRCIDWLDIKRRTGQDACHPPEDVHTDMKEYSDRTRVLGAFIGAVSTNSISLRKLTSCMGECSCLGPYRFESGELSTALRNVRDLHLCGIWYLSKKDARNDNARQEILKAASASVERLHLGTVLGGLGADFVDVTPFQRLAEGTHFQRLTELKISTMRVTIDTLPELFSSTLLTLRRLELSDIQIEKTRSAIEGVVRWRRVFEKISEHLRLEFVGLTDLGHGGIYWDLIDPVHGYRSRKPLTSHPKHALWDASKSDLVVREWMSRVRFEVRPGDFYSMDDRGSYIFGEDLERDAWVERCLNPARAL